MEYIVNLNLSEYLLLFQILGVYLGVEFQTHPIMNIKRNIIFALESRKKNGVPIVENVPIRMRVIYASQRIEFTTGYRIDVAKWDSDKQRVKNGCTNKLKQSASEINADLLKYYAEIQNVFKEFEVQETMPTTQQLKDAFNLRMKNANEEQQEEAQISFWEVFDEIDILVQSELIEIFKGHIFLELLELIFNGCKLFVCGFSPVILIAAFFYKFIEHLPTTKGCIQPADEECQRRTAGRRDRKSVV